MLPVAAGVAVLFFLLLVMLFVLQGKVNNLTNEVGELRDDLKNIIEIIDPDTEPEPTAPNTDPSGTTDPPGSTGPTGSNNPIPNDTIGPNRPNPDDSVIDTQAPDAQQ